MSSETDKCSICGTSTDDVDVHELTEHHAKSIAFPPSASGFNDGYVGVFLDDKRGYEKLLKIAWLDWNVSHEDSEDENVSGPTQAWVGPGWYFTHCRYDILDVNDVVEHYEIGLKQMERELFEWSRDRDYFSRLAFSGGDPVATE